MKMLSMAAKQLIIRSRRAGGLGAGSLGDIQGPKAKLASKLCKVHRKWRTYRFYRSCTKCGYEEEI